MLDVKVGRGAFMKTEADARMLATWLVGIAERNGVRTEALLTSMDAPLGRAVGNANEVIESIETLKGRGPKDLEDLSVRLAARMLVLAGVAATATADASGACARALASGAGLEKFRAIIEEQGGDPRVIDDYGRLPAPARETWSRRDAAGVVSRLDAELDRPRRRGAWRRPRSRRRRDRPGRRHRDPDAGRHPMRPATPMLRLACDDARNSRRLASWTARGRSDAAPRRGSAPAHPRGH